MKFLNTLLLTIIRCLCRSPPSNQHCWLSADVIIINLFRQASDDWWEAHPNQWRMHDKCLLWRLWQPHLRCSGFFLLIIPPTQQQQITLWHLDQIFNQGLSDTWHYFSRICYSARFYFKPQTWKQMSYFTLPGFDGNVSSCTSILDACEAMFFQAYVIMEAITPFWVQTLIETLCIFVLDHADNRTFCYIFLSGLISNFFLNISWVSFMFI